VARHKAASSTKRSRRVSKHTFADTLIDWQRQHGRHKLPWQDTRDGYRVWLSEVMLQQTQVATVINYYQRFLDRFPDLESLAAARASDVMALWSGLGYYSRARNLHHCAQQVVAEYGGTFPSEPETLATLPGIGRSTASAIAVFTAGKTTAILDGNVKRVLTRVFGISGYPGEKKVEQQLWSLAESLLPTSGIEAYTQGLMDLGATICTRNKPLCSECPMANQCVALTTKRTSELPERKKKQSVPQKQVAMLVIINRKQILLEQRPDSGIWGGLLSLPEVEWPKKADAADFGRVAQAAGNFGDVTLCEPLPPISHTFTHFKLQIFPFVVTLKRRTPVTKQGAHSWHRLDDLGELGLPAPVRKLLQKMGSGESAVM
jgi:A/G-specific adenine glycosylase